MIFVDISRALKELQEYQKDTVRRLENMVRGFAYTISQTAITNTPIGNAEEFLKLYQRRQTATGLEPIEGFARGSWQVNTSGQFSMQAIYGVNSGNAALTLVKTDLGSYKLGDTVFIGNRGFYIKLLENNYSSQTNNLGIIQPTLDSIMSTYQVDLPRFFQGG